MQPQAPSLPPFLYGTAWKEERTEALVLAALRAGFRGIDTANQRKHYHEAGVGAAIQGSLVERKDLFLQSKFTFLRGQDHRLPYDANASVATQVAQSFESSLAHLGVESLDALLLHGPSVGVGLAATDWEAWRAMEALHDAGRVRFIGISNVALDQLEMLHAGAHVKPSIVQNRTFTRPRADEAVRAFCRENALAYEGFSLLTAIPQVLTHPSVARLATRDQRSAAEVIFAWCRAKGIIILTGTSSDEHMKHDLSVVDYQLGEADLAMIDAIILPTRR